MASLVCSYLCASLHIYECIRDHLLYI